MEDEHSNDNDTWISIGLHAAAHPQQIQNTAALTEHARETENPDQKEHPTGYPAKNTAMKAHVARSRSKGLIVQFALNPRREGGAGRRIPRRRPANHDSTFRESGLLYAVKD
jgi:hypothetical protein